MSDIKSVIALLCKHLNLLYGCNIRNEHFRLAKFNEAKDNTVMLFWQLLSDVLKDNEEVIAFNEDNITDYVKLNLCLLKYNSLEFYSLPSDMSSGSRELLLAFGWLMASRKVLEEKTYKKMLCSKINKEFGETDSVEMSVEFPDKGNVETARDICDLALWYAGKIRHKVNAITELSSELTDIMTKVHEDTLSSCGLPHLSVGDAKLIYDLQNSQDGGQSPPIDMEGLKESVTLTETLKHWHRKDDLFWEWMESVIKEREKTVSPYLNIEQKQSLASFVALLKRSLEMLVREMKKAASSGLDVSKLFQKDPEEFIGLPRFILQDHCDDSNIKTLIQNYNQEINELEKQLQEQLEVAKSSLKDLRAKIPGVRILKM